jgi:hypothetical protein
MDIHKPKPVHNWREFASEIAVIVCGILIALMLEQVAEAWRLHEKVEIGEASIRAEFSDQLAYATIYLKLKPEMDERIARLEAASIARVHKEAARLAALPAPFSMRPWSVAAWDAAASEQIVSHLDPERRKRYEILRRQANSMLELQYRVKDNYSTLLGSRMPVDGDALIAQQISAAEHLRSDSAFGAIVTRSMIDTASKLELHPTPERIKKGLEDLRDCRTPGSFRAPGSSYVC